MGISWVQKLRLGLRGWNRRRDEQRASRDQEFLKKNASWSPAPAAAPVSSPSPATGSGIEFDLDGLQVAFLDDSGQMEHYLDLESGEVVEFLSSEASSRAELADPRYARVPRRSPESDAIDRIRFSETLEDSTLQSALAAALRSADPSGGFRKTLATNRAAERAWYNYKNERAYEAIETWIATLR